MAKRRKKDPRARELRIADELCLAFANTTAGRRDDRYRVTAAPQPPGLAGYGDLLDWSQRMGVVGNEVAERLNRAASQRPEEAAELFHRAIALRAVVGRIFNHLARKGRPAREDLETLNAALVEWLPRRRVAVDGDAYNWIWLGDDQAFERVLWPILLSAGDLLTSPDREWVRVCADTECPRLFVDRRSRRRMWCDTNTCGARDRGRRSYRRSGRIR